MKRVTKVIIGTGMAIMMVGGLAACKHHYKSPEDKVEYIAEKINNKLDLTETQQIHLDQLKGTMLAIATEMKLERAHKHQTMLELFSQPTLDQGRILNLVTEHTTRMQSNAPEVVVAVAALYDSLTPEQQTIVREEIGKHHQRGGHHRR